MIANALTGFRVLISIALLFCPVFSPVFYILYLTGGISDMADGIIARRTNTVSEFGTRFDTIADFVFVVVCLIKLLPMIRMPIWLCVWIVIIALIKIVNIISGYIVQMKLAAVHGTLLFEHEYSDDEGLISWMLSCRSKVTVIEPESVRDKLYQIACEMKLKYERTEKKHGKQSADSD